MKGIVITSDKSEVFTLYNSKNEDKIRERLKFFRGAGYSDSCSVLEVSQLCTAARKLREVLL